MSGKKDIIGISNLVTDREAHVTDDQLKEWGLEKAGTIFREPNQLLFMDKLEFVKRIPGGSAANTIVCASYLALRNDGIANRNGLVGTLGDDEIGKFYRQSTFFTQHNGKLSQYIIDYITTLPGGESGYCLILVTPDGERTQLPQLRVATDIRVPTEEIFNYKYLHITGYEIISSEPVLMEAIEHAYNNGVGISFDLSEHDIVKKNLNKFNEIGKKSTIITGNEFESKAYVGLDPLNNPEEYASVDFKYIAEEMARHSPIAIVKLGDRGSLIKPSNGPIIEIPAYKTNMLDATGAGDGYNGGFLYAMIKGYSPEEAGHLSSKLGARCCEVYGGRINSQY